MTDAAGELPDDLDGLHPQFITSLLKQADLPDAPVVAGIKGDWVSTGGGFSGRVARLAIEYAGPPGPAFLIAKFPATNPAIRQLLGRFGGYANEVAFYRELSRQSPIEVPRFYGAALSEDRMRFILLLEDLQVARTGDQQAGATHAETLAVLSAIARFHSHWWQRCEDRELACLQPPNAALDIGALYQNAWPTFLQRFGDFLPAWMGEDGPALGPRVSVLAKRLADSPRTLLHGDLRLDNVMFAGTEADPRPIILDWQAIAPGRGPLDVAYFCAGSLERHAPQDVAAWVRHYHASLNRQDYQWSDCWSDFRTAVAWLWGRTVTSGAFLDFGAGAAHQRFRNALERWTDLAETCEVREIFSRL